MKKYIALLRGINVSGQKKIPMADLRKELATAGFQNVQTYIQSGNVVFESDIDDLEDHSMKMNGVIQKTFGFDVPILVLPQTDFHSIPEVNSWLTDDVDTKSLYVGFLYELPSEENLKVLEAAPTGNDQFAYKPPYIFMKYHEGMGKSKMHNNFFEQKMKVRMTTRNWNSILKLSHM